MLTIKALLPVTKLNSLIKFFLKNKEPLVDILASPQKLLQCKQENEMTHKYVIVENIAIDNLVEEN